MSLMFQPVRYYTTHMIYITDRDTTIDTELHIADPAHDGFMPSISVGIYPREAVLYVHRQQILRT